MGIFRDQGKLKSLDRCVSPLSAAMNACAVYIPQIFLLHPTGFEFFALFVIDTLSFMVNAPLERRIFTWLYPDTAVYFSGLNDAVVRDMSLQERISLYQSFEKFPKRRAIYCYFEGYLKCAPSIALITFYWHREISALSQFAVILGIALVGWMFFCGAIFIESHIFLSEKIRELHEKFDFTEVFKNTEISNSQNEFEIQEIVILAFIIIFMIGLQLSVLFAKLYRDEFDLIVKMCIVGGAGILMFCRIWYLNQKYFREGLERLFSTIKETDYLRLNTVLPFHTSPLLAQFESTYNLLSQRLRVSERKLTSLIEQEADKSRYTAIGEISSLIAHDLSGPLHAANFCVNEIAENPNTPKLDTFVERISTNIQRSIELISSLRARLRNPNPHPSGSHFVEAHKNVLRLLEMQFRAMDFQKVKFRLDPRLDQLYFKTSQVDLIHILDNLYRNSLENLLTYEIEDPQISVELHADSGFWVSILIQDNGSGLSSSRFEEMTHYEISSRGRNETPKGLGLRLTRRMAEINDGSLQVVDSTQKAGTQFRLTLPGVLSGAQDTSKVDRAFGVPCEVK